jgi:dihydrofolate reductase
MSKVRFQISMSLDGYVAGPDQTLEEPLGRGGEQLHEWMIRSRSWREAHGLEGGESGPDDNVAAERQQGKGAYVMGRGMFSGGAGPWESDPNAAAWWGDDPPFRAPVFVLTHHRRDPVVKQGGTTYTFVTGGIEAAVEQAEAAAGDLDVEVAGGASIVQQTLRARLLDELNIHLAPVLLGGGVRLFEGVEPAELELTRVLESPHVTHLRYVPKR